ncbi:MAG: DUF4173 domain-containing protein [Gemmatimonadota bacterium]|nr:DUF4173 domain-containing protein [Gemmatimonadota bacterium]
MITSTSRIATPVPLSLGGSRVLLPVALLAVGADLLLRAPAAGLNLTLWVGAAVGAWWFERGGAAALRGRAEQALLLVALLLAAGFSWRENETLRFLDILGILVVFGLLPFAVARETGRGEGSLSLGRLIVLGGWLVARGARGPVPALLEAGGSDAGRRTLARKGPVFSALRGLALGVPLVLLFGGLLGAADPHFGGFLQSLVRIDLPAVASHTVGIGMGAWVSAALIGGVLLVEQERAVTPLPGASRSLGVIELGLTLGMLDLLFGGFIAFQLPYFFGGVEVVLAREGLTFADYARRGFGELVVVSALVLPMLLVLEPRVDCGARGARTLFGALAQTTLILLVVIMGSALHRMSLYASQYGLTEDRFFATAFITGIGVTALWFSATVLRGAAHRFLPGAIAAWVAWLGALHVVNPERVIVETNLERVAEGQSLDFGYLQSLSTDAVPALVAGAGYLTPTQRVALWSDMGQKTARGEADWRAWHYGRARARRLLDRSGS